LLKVNTGGADLLAPNAGNPGRWYSLAAWLARSQTESSTAHAGVLDDRKQRPSSVVELTGTPARSSLTFVVLMEYVRRIWAREDNENALDET
jgi:hypothetical protein